MPQSHLRVVTGEVGGSFGMKSGVYPEVVLVLWAARRLGRDAPAALAVGELQPVHGV